MGDLSGFMAGLAGYLHARLQLISLEGKAAVKHIAFAVGFGIVSALFLLFFWAVLMGAVGLLIYEPPANWLWYLGGVVLAHLLLIAGVIGLTKVGALTMSVPTAASTLGLWALLTLGFGIYIHVADKNVGGVFLAIAGLHVLLAAVLVLAATLRLKKVSLKTTMAELEKDREWLKNLKNQAPAQS